MLKTALRRQMLEKRLAYHPEEVEALSQQICRQFFSFFDFSTIRVLHVFLPITHKNEVNTWPIIKNLEQSFPDVSVTVPVTDMINQNLAHYLLKPETSVIHNKWGIPEPLGTESIPDQEIDMVLVPLLAFDENGHRVGYGKGFYDRFLAKCRPDVITVGLSLEDEVVPFIMDVHEADITLKYVVTPKQVYRFN